MKSKAKISKHKEAESKDKGIQEQPKLLLNLCIAISHNKNKHYCRNDYFQNGETNWIFGIWKLMYKYYDPSPIYAKKDLGDSEPKGSQFFLMDPIIIRRTNYKE
jgi:hypothetical protein